MTSLDRVAVELAAHEKVIADGLQTTEKPVRASDIDPDCVTLTHEEWSR